MTVYYGLRILVLGSFYFVVSYYCHCMSVSVNLNLCPVPEVINFFMLNSVEDEILNARKYKK